MRRPVASSGFSIVELLTTIAIMGILVGLLVPAIQFARESSRLAQCRSNIRQIGLGLHEFQAALGGFPPHIDSIPVPGPGEWYLQANEHMQLLPYVGQQALYDSLLAEARGESIAPDVRVPVFICPSAGMDTAVTCYPANLGSHRYAGDGAFRFQSTKLRPSDFLDGLSTTLMVAEWVPDYNGSPWSEWQVRTDPANDHDSFRRDCLERRSTDPARRTESGFGVSWRGKTGYDHLLPPFSGGCSADVMYETRSAFSRHGRSLEVLMGGGEARTIYNSIDLAVWNAIGTRNGSEMSKSR